MAAAHLSPPGSCRAGSERRRPRAALFEEPRGALPPPSGPPPARPFFRGGARSSPGRRSTARPGGSRAGPRLGARSSPPAPLLLPRCSPAAPGRRLPGGSRLSWGRVPRLTAPCCPPEPRGAPEEVFALLGKCGDGDIARILPPQVSSFECVYSSIAYLLVKPTAKPVERTCQCRRTAVWAIQLSEPN